MKRRVLSFIAVLILCISVTLTAVACSEKEPFTVIFEANGGTLISGQRDQEVKSASEIKAPVFDREHYEFIGWDTDLSKIKKHTVVNAKWRERYFLTFDYAPGIKYNVYPDQAINELPTPTGANMNKTFKFWTIDSQSIDADTVWEWKEDKQARAVWLGENEYVIELFYEEGSVETENPLTYSSETETFSIVNPTRTGYTFLGWKNLNEQSEELLDSIVIIKGSTGDRKYQAQWLANEYNISFNAQSGDVDVLSKKATTDQEIGELPTPVNGICKFLGWFYQGVKVESSDIYQYGEDVELVAKYEYVITFQLWSMANSEKLVNVSVIGGDPEDLTVDSDYVMNTDFPPKHRIKLLNVDTKEFEFYGWIVNNKKFDGDGTDGHYLPTTTVEQLMMELKVGKIKEQLLREEFIESGKITVIARSRSFWSSSQ